MRRGRTPLIPGRRTGPWPRPGSRRRRPRLTRAYHAPCQGRQEARRRLSRAMAITLAEAPLEADAPRLLIAARLQSTPAIPRMVSSATRPASQERGAFSLWRADRDALRDAVPIEGRVYLFRSALSSTELASNAAANISSRRAFSCCISALSRWLFARMEQNIRFCVNCGDRFPHRFSMHFATYYNGKLWHAGMPTTSTRRP